MKIAIIYHSESENTKKVAEVVAQGASSVTSVEVKTMSIEDFDMAFAAEAKAIIFGCPTYCGTFSWQIKKWFDTTKVNLEGKLGAAFATENYLGGGADVAELGMIGHMLVRGMLVYSAGAGKGAPFTHYGAVTIKEGADWEQERAKILGKRIAEKSLELFGHKE